MKAFNRIAIAVALFKIIGLTLPNFVLAKQNQLACKNAVGQKLKKVDPSWDIQLFAKLRMLDIIKIYNQEKLSSDTARRILTPNNLGSFSSDNSSLDCSSTEVPKKLKTLLDAVCRGLS
jgi:hypothetical protein